MNRKGFTLIELLVVVAIIGILVTILMPSLGRAREAAKLTVCLSNHKQMAVAYNIYANGNNHFAITHRWYRDFVGPDGQHGWGRPSNSLAEADRPLNKFADPGIAECPSDIGKGGSSKFDSEFKPFGSSYYVTYATGSSVGKSTNIFNSAGWKNSGIMTVKFEYPDKKALFYTANFHNNVDWYSAEGQAQWHDKKNPRDPQSFLDGHAEVQNYWWKKSGKRAPNYGTTEAKISGLGYY